MSLLCTQLCSKEKGLIHFHCNWHGRLVCYRQNKVKPVDWMLKSWCCGAVLGPQMHLHTRGEKKKTSSKVNSVQTATKPPFVWTSWEPRFTELQWLPTSLSFPPSLTAPLPILGCGWGAGELFFFLHCITFTFCIRIKRWIFKKNIFLDPFLL